MKLVFILLVLGFIKTVLLYRAYRAVPLHELRRRARSGDRKAGSIYKVVAYGPVLDIFLWISGVALGATLLIWSARYEWWLASLILIFFAWLVVWAPQAKDNGWLWAYAAFGSRYFSRLLSYLQPVLEPLAKMLPASGQVHVHTGLYEKEDLLELLSAQNHQIDNRVPEQDLKIARGALTFGDHKVADVMTPRKKVRFVLADESIGPMLMDELHKTGQTRFPVVREIKKNIEPEVIGTLLLNDLIGREDEGSVSRLMKKGVHFINEASNLHQALDAFLKTRAHLLVVVNNFEEVSGVLTQDAVLTQIIGQSIKEEFSDYHDLKAVAGHSPQVKPEHHEPTVHPNKNS